LVVFLAAFAFGFLGTAASALGASVSSAATLGVEAALAVVSEDAEVPAAKAG
jgi:hypothetical protein